MFLAATCYSTNGLTHHIPVQDGLYKVAVGKYTRNITKMDNEFTQIIDVTH